MPDSAQSINNVGTNKDASGPTKVASDEVVKPENRSGSYSVTYMNCDPRLPSNADAGKANREALTGLELPLDSTGASSPLAAPSLALPVNQAVPTRVLSILITDDVAMNRDIAALILRAAGHEITCVTCGAEAIAAIKIKEFDVVLMDVRMPLMDGLEATRRIRRLEGRRGSVPIVALTAQDFPEQIEECRTAGMNGHVSKPFDPDKLAAAVISAALAGSVRDQHCGTRFTTVSIPALTARSTGSDLRVIDLEVFKRTASFLAPSAVAAYLRKITALAKALLVMLDGPEVPEYSDDEFAGAAHIVAGTAGMFGFERITVASRQFEQAKERGTSEAALFAGALSAAIKATLPEIRSQTVGAVYRDMQPSI